MDLIHFSHGVYPQYSTCEYAKVSPDAGRWGEGFDVVICSHPESKFVLYVSNCQFNSCLNDKKNLLEK